MAGVAQWNDVCAAGVDEALHYDPQWLRPVVDPPFYALKVNGTILNTFCGLATVPETQQVIDETGTPIAGLYATGTTMGGSSGNGSMGATMNPGGGVGFACATAWSAASAVMQP